MRDHYYFDSASQILTALSQSGDARVALTRAMQVGCGALHRLQYDLQPGGDIGWALAHLSDKQLADEARKRLAAVGNFLDAFRAAELDAMTKAGVATPVVQFVHGVAEDAMKTLDAAGGGAFADTVIQGLRQRIEALRVEVCNEAAHMESVNRKRGLAKKCLCIVGGAGVIKLNASVDAVTTLGLAPWMTSLSGKLGVALWGRGIDLPPPEEGGDDDIFL